VSDDRNLDHQGLEILSRQECLELAASTPVGRVAFVEAGEPMVFPVNHGVRGEHIYFRTSKGALLHEAVMRQPVAFEVDGFDAASRTGWSVLVRGQARVVDDDAEIEGLDLEVWPDAVSREDWVTLLAEEMTGRRIFH
jgi:nitroimidazol reductase NimA-like FMN-containing flavoprotein (pyridoxamine 5'-phosphate oxidase superfamily)